MTGEELAEWIKPLAWRRGFRTEGDYTFEVEETTIRRDQLAALLEAVTRAQPAALARERGEEPQASITRLLDENDRLRAHAAALEEDIKERDWLRRTTAELDGRLVAKDALVGRLEKVVEAARELAGAAHHLFPGDVHKGQYMRFTDRWDSARATLDEALRDLDATR